MFKRKMSLVLLVFVSIFLIACTYKEEIDSTTITNQQELTKKMPFIFANVFYQL